MIRRLLNLALVVVLAPLLFAFTYEGIVYVASVFTFDATKWFLAGAAVSLLVYVLFLNNNIDFVEHLLHESEHAAVAFLFTLQLPTRMEIDPEKGSKVVAKKGGGCLRMLAPYYLPLLTAPLLLLKALTSLVFSLLELPFPSLLAAVFDVLIGATLMFHFVCSVKEFRSSRKDIKTTGLIASVIAVLFLNFMFLVLSVAVVTGSYVELLDYVRTALAVTVDTYKMVFEFFTTRVVPLVGKLIGTVSNRSCQTCTPTPTP